MDNYSKEVKDIIRWGRLGSISCVIAQKLNISPLQALKDFFRSETCRLFHDRTTGLHLFSDRYIAEDYVREQSL